MQIDMDSGWTVSAGQFWSLMTTNRHGIATRAEFIPNTSDGSYVVGSKVTGFIRVEVSPQPTQKAAAVARPTKKLISGFVSVQ